MVVTAILVDWRPEYLRSERTPGSLLLAPVGTATLLQHVREQVLAADVHTLTIVPNFEPDEHYRQAILALAPDVAVASPAGFADFLDSHEPSDWLLLVDARQVPASGFEFRVLLRDAADCRLTKHVVQLERNTGGTKERVLCDENLRVRGIQRLYDGVTQLETAGVSSSLVSVAVARHIAKPELFCLQQLRTRLAACGVPSRDITATGPALELSQERALLALNERFVISALSGPLRPSFSALAPNVWAGPGCRVHPDSRIHGPVVLHANVTIERNATVIGPTVLASGAHVEREAVVAQSLLGPQTRIRSGDCVGLRVVVAGTEDAAAPPEPRLAAPRAWPTGLSALQQHNGNGRAWPDADAGRAHAGLKRVLDFQAALFGLIILSPLLLVAALLVKLTSRGPALFCHTREGLGGKVFRCWKYRTMVDRAHAQQRELYKQNAVDGPQFKMPDDPRITWIGGWLRATNIDELPQLLNVLRGDMSLIGPRPSPFRENQICVPWRKARLSVRPGITGLWQVCRNERSAGDFHQWIFFDILYVRHLSFWLDLRVLLATLLTLGGRWSVPLTWMIPARKRRRWALAMGAPAQPSADVETTIAEPAEASQTMALGTE